MSSTLRPMLIIDGIDDSVAHLGRDARLLANALTGCNKIECAFLTSSPKVYDQLVRINGGRVRSPQFPSECYWNASQIKTLLQHQYHELSDDAIQKVSSVNCIPRAWLICLKRNSFHIVLSGHKRDQSISPTAPCVGKCWDEWKTSWKRRGYFIQQVQYWSRVCWDETQERCLIPPHNSYFVFLQEHRCICSRGKLKSISLGVH